MSQDEYNSFFFFSRGPHTKQKKNVFFLLNECPDIDVLLDGIPLQSGVLCTPSPEEVIVVDALLCLVVG